MGDYTIERSIIVFCVFLLILLAVVFTKEKRKVFIGLIVVTLVGYLIFFFARGQIFENKYEKSIETINEYLESQYPKEEWIVNDRLLKGQMRKSNKVDIVFANEKEVVYTYKVMDEGRVVQWEISLGEKHIDNLKHGEKTE